MVKRFCGVELSFQYLYFALLTVVLIIDKTGGIFCCFLASFFHEIGHLIAIILLKQKVNRVEFSLFDVKICSSYNVSLSKELIIVLSGVTFNLILFIFFYRIIPMFALANLFIGLFNALPVSTLDGGQAINILLSRYFSQRVTEIVINIVTISFSIPIFTMGIIILFNTGYNFSFLLLGVYLFLTPIYNKGIFKR
ncbi:MAG: hypothetical protein SO152_03570 [Ruminococcus sp.]|nr:hypothetical protein [Ruminococcus sp.]